MSVLFGVEIVDKFGIVSHISTLCTAPHHEVQHTAWQNLTLRHPENAKQGHHLVALSQKRSHHSVRLIM